MPERRLGSELAPWGSSGVRASGASEREPVDPRLPVVADDLRLRLRSVCAEWSEAEFEDMILRIARTKVHWTDAGCGD